MALSRSPVNVQLNSVANSGVGSASSPYYTAWVDAKTAMSAPKNPFDIDNDANAASNLQVFHLEGSGAETLAFRTKYTNNAQFPTTLVVRVYGFFPHRNTDRKNGKVDDNAGDWAFLYAQGVVPAVGTPATTITGHTAEGLTDGTSGYTPDIFVDLCGASKVIVIPSTAAATSTTAAIQARFMAGAGNR